MAVLGYKALVNAWLVAGGNPAAADTAAAVALAESGGDTSAINNTAYKNRPNYHPPAKGNLPEYSVGLWQINMLAHPSYTQAKLLTAIGNAKAAIAISSDGLHWSPWSTFTSGAYKQYLQNPGSTIPQPGQTNPPTAASSTASGHSGYADLRWSVAKHLHTQLVHSRRTTATTFRLLAHRGRVHH